MEMFFNILAWVFLFLCAFRIAGIYVGSKEQEVAVRLAELYGANPVGDALVKPVIVFLICAAWIVSTLI